MVSVLEAAYASKKAYQKLIQTTDDLVKSQFIGIKRAISKSIGGAIYA